MSTFSGSTLNISSKEFRQRALKPLVEALDAVGFNEVELGPHVVLLPKEPMTAMGLVKSVYDQYKADEEIVAVEQWADDCNSIFPDGSVLSLASFFR